MRRFLGQLARPISSKAIQRIANPLINNPAKSSFALGLTPTKPSTPFLFFRPFSTKNSTTIPNTFLPSGTFSQLKNELKSFINGIDLLVPQSLSADQLFNRAGRINPINRISRAKNLYQEDTSDFLNKFHHDLNKATSTDEVITVILKANQHPLFPFFLEIAAEVAVPGKHRDEVRQNVRNTLLRENILITESVVDMELVKSWRDSKEQEPFYVQFLKTKEESADEVNDGRVTLDN
jgi:hypothetical protein